MQQSAMWNHNDIISTFQVNFICGNYTNFGGCPNLTEVLWTKIDRSEPEGDYLCVIVQELLPFRLRTNTIMFAFKGGMNTILLSMIFGAEEGEGEGEGRG